MYLIGLTGNIASGKSTVRRMLEELGAYAIDADALAHAVLKKGTSGWQAVAATFGTAVLKADGEIDRQKLGAIVFADSSKLRELESIVHPAVSAEIGRLLSATSAPVVVIEAVKLVEAELNQFCDALWIVTTPAAEAKRRLMRDRRMSDGEAELRLNSQPPLEPKLRLAQVIVRNDSSVEATREQVARAYSRVRPETGSDKTQFIRQLQFERGTI